jgi:hypothetical protein
MKKILLTSIAITCSFAAFGQGFVNFENFNTESTVNFGPHFTPAPLGNPGFTVALLWYNGTSFQNIDTFQSSTANVGAANPGYFIAGTVTIPTYTSTGTFEVQGWYNTAGNYATYAAATAAATGTTYAGTTAAFTATEGQTPTTPTDIANFNPGGWNGNLSMTPVPEPTTIALGALGGAALLLFRRRK